ncbi:hypothetical protein C6499_22570 [Candidatus Poribacteria bacterium]|nr:MAG: hypothetical protein C6499_22570 [Candidatus Poribacteria bacterium]
MPAKESAIGLGFQYYEPPSQITGSSNYRHQFRVSHIRGSLDYQFNPTLKISFLPGIAFLNIPNQQTIDVPPSPSVELQLAATGPLIAEKTIDYFLRGAFQSHYSQIYRNGEATHYINMTVTGGIGVIGKLWTTTKWGFHPFFGVFYSNRWRNTSTTRRIIVDDTYNLFTGEAGVEIQASPTTHIIGSVGFSFQASEVIYNIGINFR